MINKDEQQPNAALIHESKKKDVVKAILKKEKQKGKWYYLVKWEAGDETWEPIKNISDDVPSITKKFEESLK